MPKTIHKQTVALTNLDSEDKITGPLPKGAEIVNFAWHQTSTDTLSIWYEFDAAETATEDKTVWIFGTGAEIPDGLSYVGTAFTDFLVWHLYQETTPGPFNG